LNQKVKRGEGAWMPQDLREISWFSDKQVSRPCRYYIRYWFPYWKLSDFKVVFYYLSHIYNIHAYIYTVFCIFNFIFFRKLNVLNPVLYLLLIYQLWSFIRKSMILNIIAMYFFENLLVLIIKIWWLRLPWGISI